MVQCGLVSRGLWRRCVVPSGLALPLFGLLAGATVAPSIAHGRQSAEKLTLDLITLHQQHRAAESAEQHRLLRELVATATARQELLAALLETDPGAVLRVAIPRRLRAALPFSVRPLVERDAFEAEGELELLHEDRASGSRYLHFLKTGTERLSLHFAGDAPALPTASRVRVKGVRVKNALALASSTSVTTLATVSPNTLGEQRTLVILVNFADNPTEPYTPATAQSLVFGSTSSFYWENSYQQTWLTGDVAGWFTIDLSSTVCDFHTLAGKAEAAATAAGFNVPLYRRLIYGFPDNACAWWGLGTVGGNPSQAWVNGSLAVRVAGHELGHNFGDYHSHSMACDTSGCVPFEYGDGWDIMGATVGHLNAFQKERLGWLNYGTSPPITTAETSGNYWLDPYEPVGSQPKALKVLESTDAATGDKTWYYLEYRGAQGFDSLLPSGVLLRIGSDSSPNSSYLWDMFPDTSISDALLDVGQSFTDPSTVVILATLSADSSGAMVQVTIGSTPTPCVQANPGIGVSPLSTWVSPGTAATYTVTVTNNDSSTCGTSSFALAATPPDATWIASFASPVLTLAPGATGSTTLKITSPAATPDGFYTIMMTATNSGEPTYAASTSATEVATTQGGGCQLSAATPTVKDKMVKQAVKNTEPSTATISELMITWPSTNGDLVKVKRDGDDVWTVGATCSTTPSCSVTIADGLTTDVRKRSIQPDQTRQLTFQFEKNASTDLTAYTWEVDFGTDCSITH